ncbi:MAG TPA: hypothetical protein VJG49_04160 [Candidatus Nanoarchaeia archaeon]|nr:hypothetical protein [Candidatus Nanoarchaeia archaeon]
MEKKIGKRMFFSGILIAVLFLSVIFLSTTPGPDLFLNEQKVERPGHQLEKQLLFYSPYAGPDPALPADLAVSAVTAADLGQADRNPIYAGDFQPAVDSQKLAEVAEVLITQTGFEPKEITIKVNQKLVWKNEQDKLPALVLGVREIYELRSGLLEPGQEFIQVFSQPGEYTYVDGIVLGRVGKVVVQ